MCKINNLLLLFCILIIFNSCSEYSKALKSKDTAVKYEMAEKQYDNAKYHKAIRLFEQIATSYRGKPQAEKLFYMYSQSLYKTKQYEISGYQFESFVSSYPKSEKKEEAAFLGAKGYYFLSPVYSLDQEYTYRSIDKLQNFIDTYPNSQYMDEANKLVQLLKTKLEKKAFEVAKLYNTISDYKSAIIALDMFISDYPGTMYKEDALYYKFDSTYQLAINSVFLKMEERLTNAKLAYNNLIKFKKDTQYKEKADKMLATIDQELQQFSK